MGVVVVGLGLAAAASGVTTAAADPPASFCSGTIPGGMQQTVTKTCNPGGDSDVGLWWNATKSQKFTITVTAQGGGTPMFSSFSRSGSVCLHIPGGEPVVVKLHATLFGGGSYFTMKHVCPG